MLSFHLPLASSRVQVAELGEEGLAISNVTGGSSLPPEASLMKVAEVMAARRMTRGKALSKRHGALADSLTRISEPVHGCSPLP